MANLTVSKLFPALTSLRDYLVLTVDAVEATLRTGRTLSADQAAKWLEQQMIQDKWSPVINGVAVLDEPTRKAGARFLAGIALALTRK
jgi:hypothetical protein